MALAAGVVPSEVFATPDDETTRVLARAHGIEVTPVTGEVLGKVADSANPRGPVAVIEIPAPVTPSKDLLLVLVDIADPGNLGTMIRTAAAFGFDVWVAGGADPWSPKVLRAAAGAHFDTGLRWAPDWSTGEVVALGYRVVASVVDGGRPPAELAVEGHRDALLIGSEAHGLASEVIERADAHVTIPMPGTTESLNAAIAASILMYAWRAVR